MFNRRSKLAAIGLALTLTAAACGGDSDDADDAAPSAETTATTAAEVVEVDGPFGPACDAVPTEGEGSFAGMTDDPAATAASNNPLLSTLVSAVGEAGLVDTLNSDGPFTIFAPVNDAFAAIPTEDLEAILADTELLTSILTYHVVAGDSLDAEALGAQGTAQTVNGAELSFGADGTTVNGVDVVCSDVMTANATVHIIGEVLVPDTGEAMEEDMGEEMEDDMAADTGDMADVVAPTGPLCAAVPVEGEGSFAGMTDDPAAIAASNNPALSTLVAAVTQAGLVDTLNSDGPFTIFAPADPAFEAIPAADLEALLADVDALTSVLTFHVVAGERLSSADLAGMDSIETVQGGTLTLSVEGDTLSVNGQATVGCADVQTANAVVHIIDGVLLP